VLLRISATDEEKTQDARLIREEIKPYPRIRARLAGKQGEREGGKVGKREGEKVRR
jgi:hypothetical protein